MKINFTTFFSKNGHSRSSSPLCPLVHLIILHISKPVNYPLSEVNGLPASQTSQPTISTGIDSGSPCPILYSCFFILFALILPLIYFLLHLYLCHALPRISDIPTSLRTDFLCLYSGIYRRNISDCWHKMYLF